MATNPISFTNTPQAGDDNYTWTETQLQSSTQFNSLTNVITLNVMSNDLGGAAKKLWSIQDVNGNSLDNGYSVMKDGEVFSGVSAWETTDQGNQFRIANGQIEYKIVGDINALGEGDSLHDVFNYTIRLANGTLSEARVTVHVDGVNDLATITGDSTGSVVEDTTLTVSGDLDVTDVDAGEDEVQPIAAGTAGDNDYGTFEVAANGEWTYTLDNTDPAVQALPAGATLTDTITVTSEDGTDTQVITITITGTNDVATISGTVTGAVTEDSGDYTESALITVSDVDTGENELDPDSGSTAHGSYTVSTTGWSYTANNAALQSLGEGVTATDTFTISSEDGSDSETVSITLTGVNDLATISGALTGDITEDSGDYSESATITVSDVDTGENVLQATSGSTAHGTYNVTASGWSFTADNSTLQSLGEGVTATDTFTISSEDGSDSETVVITFHGVADGDPDDFDNLVTSTTPVIMTSPGPGGSNTILGSTGDDTLYGGAGDDTLYGGAGNDFINGEGGADALYGGSGNDILVGEAGVDKMYGGSGNDSLDAGAGADVQIFGGLGNDTIVGSDGTDTISGGSGADIFKFTTVASGFGTDTLTDFDASAPGSGGDTLDISAVLDMAGNTWADGGTVNDAVTGGFLSFSNVGGNIAVTVDINGPAGGGGTSGVVTILQGVPFTTSAAAQALLQDNFILG